MADLQKVIAYKFEAQEKGLTDVVNKYEGSFKKLNDLSQQAKDLQTKAAEARAAGEEKAAAAFEESAGRIKEKADQLIQKLGTELPKAIEDGLAKRVQAAANVAQQAFQNIGDTLTNISSLENPFRVLQTGVETLTSSLVQDQATFCLRWPRCSTL